MFPLHHRIGKETEKRQGVHALYILSLRSMEGWFIVTHHADLRALSPSLSVRKAPSLHDFTLMLA